MHTRCRIISFQVAALACIHAVRVSRFIHPQVAAPTCIYAVGTFKFDNFRRSVANVVTS
ncbi:hypothetical protein PF005_g3337 [Phytophthora fragariae]|uniref:Secreted protein n=2 Tax=Phytophthora TaxID=4783 RepID=A0A6A3FVG8_9STRA|nr:hypothetical protein PF003_g529 [Phytophthora fragariae]KAE9042175.1 hypothetical protein PR002_g4042 [Phytophthora rubi]KAE8948447.1 hypothetical protein PF009_g1988 [Phytophthora fragariae]KAE9023507.1 hypothetical protein PF011_g3962 [Phytophthora fragariae]KAE9047991.1 hypothetical protein PR001_g3987 [Phytophthora rubi]